MTTELNNLQLQYLYDNLTTQHFDSLLKIVSDRLETVPNDFIDSLYQNVSKSRRLTFKQFSCFTNYIKKADTEYKQF